MAKPKRRQYGTGSIYQRSSDGRWFGATHAGWTERGTRRIVTVSAATEAEAKRRLRDKQAALEQQGTSVEHAGTRSTVKKWADEWIATTHTKLRPKSYVTDMASVNRWIIPTIGHKRLDSLTPADIRAVATAIRAAGRSGSTALRTHIVLMKLLRSAIVEGHQVPQRVLMVESPGKSVSGRDAIEFEDAIAMLKVAAETPDGSRWVAAFLQGMRPGECLGLTWPLVDLAGGSLDISWQLQSLPYVKGRTGPLRVPDGYEYRQLDGALCLVRPKTEKGQRIIPLVPWMADALTKWKDIAPPSKHGLVWSRPDGRPKTGKADRAAWLTLQDAAQVARVEGVTGRRYDLYEARHTTATLLLEAGTDPTVVTAIMGHSTIMTSRLYQHVSQAMARQALDGIAERLQLR